MDSQANVLTVFLDPTMAIAVVEVVVLVGSIVRDSWETKRKRADPRMIFLSEHLADYRPHRRLGGQDKVKN